MKLVMFILSLCFFSSTVFACEEPARVKVSSLLHVVKSPTYWRTVKGKTYKANRAYPALATVLRNIKKSYVDYDGDIYKFDEEGVVLCDRKRSNEITAIHPDATARITRTGNGKEAMLTIRSGIVTIRLRPAEVVSN